MTPLKAIRYQCHFCLNDQASEITKCSSKDCVFYYLRMGKNNTNPRKSALRQIRKYCLDCGDGWKGVKDCKFTDCALYQYRFGKNPACAGRRGNLNFKSKKKLPYA